MTVDGCFFEGDRMSMLLRRGLSGERKQKWKMCDEGNHILLRASKDNSIWTPDSPGKSQILSFQDVSELVIKLLLM